MSNYNYDDEPTQYGSSTSKQNNGYDDEATQLDNPTSTKTNNTTTNKPQDKKKTAQTPKGKKNNNAQRIAVAAGAGVLLGGAATLFSSFMPHDDSNDEATPEWSDGKVPVAHGVNDDMSYDEAFTAAREEVGPGGAFTWHGNVYGTYYADEWNSMTDAERAEFADHFDWSKFDTAHNDDANQPGGNNDGDDIVAHAEPSHQSGGHADANHGGEHVATNGGHAAGGHAAQGGGHDADVIAAHHEQPSQDPTNPDGDHDVEILGVTHDDDSGMNIAAVRVDDQDAILVDVDNDNEFEVLAQDSNHNGQLEDNEMVDISDAHITTNDLGGVQNTGVDTDLAHNDVGVDYTTDSTDPNGSADAIDA